MRPRTDPLRTIEVVIVSDNPETLDGLQSYLSAAGVAARSTSEIDDCARAASENTIAFVLFPDDFSLESVIALVTELTTNQSKALPVLVTAHPKRFENLTTDSVVVMPRPVWGWTILEAIRAHLDGPDGLAGMEASPARG
jgi:DNA-binding response OmpR family regulator